MLDETGSREEGTDGGSMMTIRNARAVSRGSERTWRLLRPFAFNYRRLPCDRKPKAPKHIGSDTRIMAEGICNGPAHERASEPSIDRPFATLITLVRQ